MAGMAGMAGMGAGEFLGEINVFFGRKLDGDVSLYHEHLYDM